MSVPTSFKRLLLRAVLRNVNPIAIRLAAVSDILDLADFDEVFHAVLGWDSGIGTLSRFTARDQPPSAELATA